MAAMLTVKREGFGIELRRGRFDAVVDGDRSLTRVDSPR